MVGFFLVIFWVASYLLPSNCRFNDTADVTSLIGFMKALNDTSFSRINVGANLTVNQNTWKDRVVLTRNVTIAGDPSYPIIDLNYVAQKIDLAPGVFIEFEYVELQDLVARLVAGIALFNSAPPSSAVVLRNVLRRQRACLPRHLRTELVLSAPRPPGYPGQQLFTYVHEKWCRWQDGDLEKVQCFTPPVGRYINHVSIVPENMESQEGGYMIHYYNSTLLCDSYISDSCLNKTGSVQCFEKAMATGREQERRRDLLVKVLSPIAAVAGTAVLLGVVALVYLRRMKKKNPKSSSEGGRADRSVSRGDGTLVDPLAIANSSSGGAPPGLLLGRLLGAGSYGRVYEGQWQNMKVAVKLMVNDEATIDRLNNEIKLSMSIEHPNIVQSFFFTTRRRIKVPGQQKALKGQWSEGGLPHHFPNGGQLGGTHCFGHNTDVLRDTGGQKEEICPREQNSGACIRGKEVHDDGEGRSRLGALACDGHAPSQDQNPSWERAPAYTSSDGPARQDPRGRPRLWFSRALRQTNAEEVLHSETGQMLDVSLDCVSKGSGPHSNGQLQPTTMCMLNQSVLQVYDAPLHPQNRICPMYRKCDLEEYYESWIVQEYCDQGALSVCLARGQFISESGLPLLVALLLRARDVARGMQYLHSRSVCHGDLKCENILLMTDESDLFGQRAKVGDFGLSRAVAASRSHLSTCTYGTVTHMPPELLLEGRLSPSSDVYSFGIILWELLTCQSPYRGMSVGEVIQKVVVQDMRPCFPWYTPDPIRYLAADCWHRQRSLRPSFTTIVGRLDELIGDVEELQASMEHRFAAGPCPERMGA